MGMFAIIGLVVLIAVVAVGKALSDKSLKGSVWDRKETELREFSPERERFE